MAQSTKKLDARRVGRHFYAPAIGSAIVAGASTLRTLTGCVAGDMNAIAPRTPPVAALDAEPSDCMALDIKRTAKTKTIARCAVAPLDVASEFKVGFVELRLRASGYLDHSNGSVARAGVTLRSFEDPELEDAIKHEASASDVFHAAPAHTYLISPHEVRQTRAGLLSRVDPNADVSDALKTLVADRLRVFAVPVVGWPGPGIASPPRL